MNQISFPVAKASSFWVFMLLNLGGCRVWVGFIQTRCYIVPRQRPPPPEPLRRRETEQHCVGTAQLYGRRKPRRQGVQSISLVRHRRNSRSRDVYGDLCLNVAADRDLCWHNEPPGDH